MRTFWRTVLGILREIADEGAYQRHLQFHGREHSGEEWRKFHEARLARKYLRAKCC